jgi:porin
MFVRPYYQVLMNTDEYECLETEMREPCMFAVRGRRPARTARSDWRFAALLAALTIVPSGLARAADASDAAPKPPESAPAPTLCDGQPSISGSVPVLGDWKKALCERGFNLQVNFIGEVFGNPTGGVKQGARYEQRIELGLDGDMDAIAGIKGLIFHINSYAIAGQSLSTYNLYNYSGITFIDAHPAWLLFEAWAEYKFLDDKLSIRAGQLAADSDFFISEMGQLFLNATYGWPNLFTNDLPSGGPAYPFATPGVRVKVYASNQLNFVAAVFNGDPTGAGFTGKQAQYDPSGTNFLVKYPPFVVGEVQYAYNQDKDSTGLAGKIKFGGWYHFGSFNDIYFGRDGLSLADPDSDGTALTHNGDYSLYGVIDQMLWRLPGDDPKKGVGAFARVTATPTDRNLISFYADGGANFMGLWNQRPDDQFGVSAAYTEVSPAAHALDVDTTAFVGERLPARDYELLLEATYQAQIMPGWTVQPDFEYVFHPGGGAVNPLNPASGRIPDAAVFGVRTTVQF